MTARLCPECKRPMDIHRDEYEAFCHECMVVAFMSRAAFNDIKAMAVDFSGDENAFAATISLPHMARRAYRAAKKEAS